jgi:uncharacterized membrane protein
LYEEERMRTLEARVGHLARRVERLEAADRVTTEAAAAPAPAPAEPALAGSSRSFAPFRPPPHPRVPRPGDLEDLLGGRLLAWTGGAAVLVGIALLFALAAAQGWIGPGARVLLAGTGALALVVAGIWLEEGRGRTDAARAAVATGIAALYATVLVSAQVYELFAAPLALLGAVGVAVTGTVVALRWDARGIAALGILGAVAAPLSVGAPASGWTLALLWVALASAAGILVRRRWTWLGFAAVALAAAQWLPWMLGAGQGLGATLIVLAAFGALGVASAVGFEVRDPGARLHAPASVLLALNAMVVTAAGWIALGELGHRGLADLWPAALALAHLVLGLGGLRSRRLSRDVALLSLSLSVVLANVAFGLVAAGPLLVVSWAGGAAAFALLLRRSDRREDEALAGAGLGGHVALALAHTLLGDAPPTALLGGAVDAGPALLAVCALAAGCFASARLTAEGHASWRMALDGLGLALVAYSAALALDGPALVAAWSLEAVTLARLVRLRPDRLAAGAAVAHAALAAAHVLVMEAQPIALVDGLADVGSGALALAALAAGALAVRVVGPEDGRWQAASAALAAGVLLFLASTLLVSAFGPASGAELGSLDPRQQGQMLLSGLWGAVGVTAMVVGLRREWRGARLAGLGLLLLTVAKVFVYDLAELTSLYRVASFVALGLLLLAAAFAWQCARPREPEDLRRVPVALR